MKKYKQEELHQDNEKIYLMLKDAPAALTKKEWAKHTEEFYRIKKHINTTTRVAHQKMSAARIVNQKEQSMMLSNFSHRQSFNMLNSERKTQLQMISPAKAQLTSDFDRLENTEKDIKFSPILSDEKEIVQTSAMDSKPSNEIEIIASSKAPQRLRSAVLESK